MSSQTLLGVSAGTLVGIGAVATPVGDIPSAVFLAMSGVDNPVSCLKWMKTPTESVFSHPCSPLTDPISLGYISSGIVFIAILLIIWGSFELVGKVSKV